MDDDKGLDLSLGLPCGASSSNSKDKSGDTDERTSKIVNDFKNFLNPGIPQSFQSFDAAKPQENFFTNYSQNTAGGSTSGNGSAVADHKRKSPFEEAKNQKKQERDSQSSDNKVKSHISITTDETSTADNEDVAESEAEGSTSRMPSHRDEGSGTPVGSASSSQAPMESHERANITTSPYSVPYTITIKESSSASTPNTPSHPLAGLMRGKASSNGERQGPHTSSPGNVSMTFGYSPVQLPVLDNKDSPWAAIARPQSLSSPYSGRPISASVSLQGTNSSSADAVRPELSRGVAKSLVPEEASSSHTEEDAITRGRANSLPSEYPAIKPGIGPDVTFGGSGSFPNLPWVSTTGPGPNGKTISGVTYKYNATQVKIVCACHGTHMSTDEFVRHAAEEQPIIAAAPDLVSRPSSNHAASAKS